LEGEEPMSVQNVKNKQIIIGLTGSIATGKSTASEYLKTKGFLVIDSDEIVKDLWRTDMDMLGKISGTFDIDMMDPAAKQKLAKKIFENPKDRQKLNDIVHPKVYRKIDEIIAINNDIKHIFIDMPLLIEVGYHKNCEHVLLVYTEQDTQIERLSKRDQISKDEALKRINAQMPIHEKRAFATEVLNNNQSKEILYQDIDQFLNEVCT
jgi:dephospho-CoA kinase